MNSGIYEKSLEHILRTISGILGRFEIDNLVGLKTVVEKTKEIPGEEMQIYTSSKNNCRQQSYQSPEAQESTEEWSV